MKNCNKCKENKLDEEFWKDKYTIDGLCSQCKLCKRQSKEKRHEIYLKNKEKVLLKHKTYYNNNKEKINSQRKDYSQKYYKQVKGTLNYTYSCYKASAKRRGLEFDLTLEEFGTFQKICHYCGDFAGGLDRIHNTIGYSADNCVSCCDICNKTKRALSLDEWKNYLTQMVLYNKSNSTRIIQRKIKFYSVKGQYGFYRRSAKRRNKQFKLTLDQFKSFLHMPCQYCGSITKNIIGVDRVHNNFGYLPNNCVSCCKICNIGKNNLSIESWKNWIGSVVQYRST